MKKEKRKFIFKVTITHVVTYIVCGMVFSQMFSYQNSLTDAGLRDMNSLIVGLAPLFQIIRGLLFAVVLWWIRDVFMQKNMVGSSFGSFLSYLVFLIRQELLRVQLKDLYTCFQPMNLSAYKLVDY